MASEPAVGNVGRGWGSNDTCTLVVLGRDFGRETGRVRRALAEEDDDVHGRSQLEGKGDGNGKWKMEKRGRGSDDLEVWVFVLLLRLRG